jgi:hypothetical protein
MGLVKVAARRRLVVTRTGISRTVLLSVLMLGLAGPGAAWGKKGHCDARQSRARQNLERELARCDFAGCESTSRTQCERSLARFGCDPMTCDPPSEGGLGSALSCPADTAPGDELVNEVLDELTPQLNAAWPGVAVNTGLDPLTPVWAGTINVGCSAAGDELCGLQASSCVKEYVDISVQSLTGLQYLQFSNLDVRTLDSVDVSTHSNTGHDAGKITDGIFTYPLWPWNDGTYAVVLPTTGPLFALTVDLGEVFEVCANRTTCVNGPLLQADGNDTYRLDYSTDGASWTTLDVFPTFSYTGLETRSIVHASGSSFSARYVRVYSIAGDGGSSVSELQLWNTSNEVISTGKQALGPMPAQIVDGVLAAAGTTWNAVQYAVQMPGVTGAGSALTVDLGQTYSICDNASTCTSGPRIQADHNDQYQLDYSNDGRNWVKWDVFPTVSSGGLQTRVKQHASGSVFHARFVRVYPIAGDGNYSVSELTLWDTGNQVVSVGTSAFGPEPYVTNGIYAPEGTANNDTHFATVLVDSGTAAALQVDLRTSHPIQQLKVQADANDTYQVDVSDDRQSWTALWTVPAVTGTGLRTRTSQWFNVGLVQGRYLRLYATSGDGTYAASEMQVFTLEAETSCPYDSAANHGEDYACTYSGQFNGKVSLVKGGLISAFLNKARLMVECSFFGEKFTETIADAGHVRCNMTNPVGSATMNFCAGSCATATPLPSSISYAQVATLDFGAPTVSCDASGLPSWLTNIIVPGIKNGVINAIEPPVTDVLNDVLNEFVPFPDMCVP